MFVCFSSFLFLSCIICGRDDRPRDKERARVTKNILAGSGLPGLTRAGRTDPGSAAAHSLTLSFTCYYFARLPRPFTRLPGSILAPFSCLNSTQLSLKDPSLKFRNCFRRDLNLIIGAHLFIQSHSICETLSLFCPTLFPADYRPDKSICFL